MTQETVIFISIALVAFAIGHLLARISSARKLMVTQNAWNQNVQKHFIKREMHQSVTEQLSTKNSECIALTAENACLKSTVDHLNEKLADQMQSLEQGRDELKVQFENLANKLLDEKSEKFTQINKSAMDALLKPIEEKFSAFEKTVQDTYIKGTTERAGLKEQITQMMHLNNQLGTEAQNLTRAIKGDSQFQGTWGEMQLEKLLQNAGLVNGEHYIRQHSVRDDNGNLTRPDFLIKLPDEKHLIVDSKVSLTAFDHYLQNEDEDIKARYLKAHVKSLHNHIKNLHEKNYAGNHRINCPDYVLMFVPMEHAFFLAVQHDPRLFEKALQKNVAIVTASTLMATMRTISYIWKQENQKTNALEIARQAGMLYDKFVNFIDDMEKMGRKLQGVQDEYDAAMNKLCKGVKRGGTIVGRIEKLRELGASNTKEVPAHLRAG